MLGLALGLALAAGPVRAQLGMEEDFGPPTGGSGGLAGTPSPTPVPPAGSAFPGLLPGVRIEALQRMGPPEIADLVAKLMTREPLTPDEFLRYLRAVEASPINQQVIRSMGIVTASAPLPAQGWALIGTRLHDTQYGAEGGNADDRSTTKYGIKLFLDGSENHGWRQIDLFYRREGEVVPEDTEDGRAGILGPDGTLWPRAKYFGREFLSPKFLVDEKGRKIDIAHAYAGVAAVVMRGAVTGTLMSHVNTGWGDSYQVWSTRLSAVSFLVYSRFPGATEAWNKALKDDQGRQRHGPQDYRFSDVWKEWVRAAAFKSEDQVRGNALGNAARAWLQRNRTGSLSDAFVAAFEDVRDRPLEVGFDPEAMYP